MTRTITLLIAVLAATFVGCQGESGLEAAPADQGEEAADIEKASSLAAGSIQQIAADGRRLTEVPACEALALKFRAAFEQYMALFQQLREAVKLEQELQAQQPSPGDFENPEQFRAAWASYQNKIDQAHKQIKELLQQITQAEAELPKIRSAMVVAACREIPDPPKEEAANVEAVKESMQRVLASPVVEGKTALRKEAAADPPLDK